MRINWFRLIVVAFLYLAVLALLSIDYNVSMMARRAHRLRAISELASSPSR